MKKVSYDILLLIIGAILSVVIPAIISWANEIPFWSGFKFIFGYPIPLWGVLLILVLIYLIERIKKKLKSKPIESNLPDFINYTSDVFNGNTWRWKWIKRPGGWDIDDIRIACTNCDTSTPLKHSVHIGSNAECPRCGNIMTGLRTATQIFNIIKDNVERGIYKQ
ncbi:MAG: hypothetical protein A3D31_02075 [Candidatus Fluviicola riflensis]|nr:MAG: hypothetical protein CHH17_12960 [Candidatus Fluviicola riflensis]OGS78784.1 MAG: hypothetical protein A3D31_02075 [Candidatus Fluviicola riflensis]OGS86215.1 MAG: hypothetical protein A2724_01530 [Fluviicola sp. RIFCSPHIGHO2_01_FULL_43_53]OGS87657.1 MAG: hypothetical protein A3E30_16335 [Fluviicola sp. RIFCSPHIGHO2_12_FULL_43_24]